jgi:hypothetical protein
VPHFGLMDEEDLGPVEGPLMRARLHVRCGMRRLRQGKTAEGIATLYDALEGAMQSCLADPGRCEPMSLRAGEDRNDAGTAYAVLVRSGVLDGSFDFPAFAGLAREVLEGRTPGCDCAALQSGLESVMVQLGVMPFDEASLPPEDPNTF